MGRVLCRFRRQNFADHPSGNSIVGLEPDQNALCVRSLLSGFRQPAVAIWPRLHSIVPVAAKGSNFLLAIPGQAAETMRILLVEDHQRLARTIVDGLAGFGFGVDTFATGGRARCKNAGELRRRRS